jgi:hypothetical protein
VRTLLAALAIIGGLMLAGCSQMLPFLASHDESLAPVLIATGSGGEFTSEPAPDIRPEPTNHD